MNMLIIVLRNINKKRLRTALTVLGVAIGIGLMLSLLSIATAGVQRSLEIIRGLSGADIVVYNGSRGSTTDNIPSTPRDFRLFQPWLQTYLDADTYRAISSIPGVLIASPILMFRASIVFHNMSSTIGVYGVEPSNYLSLSSLELENGRFLDGLGVYEVVIGRAIADELGVSVGDNINLVVGNKSIILRVIGVYRALNRFAENTAYIPIDIAQNITGLNKISQILVKCSDPLQAQEVGRRITDLIPGVSVFVATATVQNLSQAINTVTHFFMTIGLIAITAGIFSIMNTMSMAVAERMREIGIMKAIGASNSFILKLFLLESTVIGFIGGITGVVIGLIISYTIAPIAAQLGIQRIFGMPMGRSGVQSIRFTPMITPLNIAISLALGVAVGIIAGIYPAYRAYRLRIVEAMRYV